VAQKSNESGSRLIEARSPRARELPPERAFVLLLDVCAQPPRRMLGRVEHVTSGRIAHITSLKELVRFLAEVLRDGSGPSVRSRINAFDRRNDR
jgi:hypothetical protein